MPFIQGKYSADERNKNRANLLTTAVVGLLALVAAAVLRSWELDDALGAIALWLVASGVAYWLFATENAGPVDLPHDSKRWFDLWRRQGP